MQYLSSELHRVFCKRMRQIRTRLGLTQAQLAEKLGVSNVRICHLETGAYVPTLDTVDQVAKALGVKARTLVTEHEKIAG